MVRKEVISRFAAIVLIASLSMAAAPTKHKTASHKTKSMIKVRKSTKTGAPGVLYAEVDWPNELRAGDCGQKPGKLLIGSDGSLHWEAVTYTYSTHSGDIWHASFELLDKDQVSLGSTPNHDSPRMNDGNGGPPPRYRWTADDRYDGSKFGAIVWVTEGSAC